jgi:glycosyltransferase involved in cell wall biosynthesis
MNLDHKVLFTGFIEDEDAHTLFSMAEIIVLPYTYSVSASGPLSIAIQHRKPIVATKTDFFNDFLTDGYDALLVSPMDYDGLAQAIEKLLTDNSLKERFSQNIDSEIQKSSWKQVAETTLKTYFQVIKS